MVMMRPPRLKCGMAAWEASTVARTFVLRIASISARLCSTNLPMRAALMELVGSGEDAVRRRPPIGERRSRRSPAQLSLDRLGVVDRRHVLEPSVDDPVNGVLDDLERRPRGFHADELLYGRARVDELRPDALA